MEVVMTQIRTSLQGYRDGLLTDISKTYNIPLEALQARYGGEEVTLPTAEPQKKKREVKDKPNAVMCKGLTAKGGPCKFVACQGREYCGIHLRKMGESQSSAPPQSQPVNKVQCKGVTAKGDPCKFLADPETCLCGTHLRKSGTSPTPPAKGKKPAVPASAPPAAPPVAPHAASAPVPDLQARLAALLAEEDEEEEPAMPEEVAMETADLPTEVTPTAVSASAPDPQSRISALLAEEDEDIYDAKSEDYGFDSEDIAEPEMALDELMGALNIETNKEKVMQQLREEDEDADEDAIEQMCETPPSRQKLTDLLGDM